MSVTGRPVTRFVMTAATSSAVPMTKRFLIASRSKYRGGSAARCRALEHVAVVRVPPVHDVLADLGPRALGIVGQEELHLPGHLRRRRVVTAGIESDQIRLVQLACDRLKPEAEPPGRTRSHRPTEPAPHRHRPLDRRRCHRALGAGFLAPEPAHLPDPLGEHAVAVLEVAVEREVLGLAVPHSETGFDAPVADDVDDRDLLGQLDRPVQREQRDCGADPQARRTRCDRSREREALREVAVVEEMVFGEPHRIGTEALGLFDALEPTPVVRRVRARPLRWVAHVDVHPEPHRRTASGRLGVQLVAKWHADVTNRCLLPASRRVRSKRYSPGGSLTWGKSSLNAPRRMR